MKKIFAGLVLISSLLQAQFTLKGTINNYSEKRILVKINHAFSDLVIGNVITDASGSFSVPVKEKYEGVLNLVLLDARQNLLLISDNTPINFTATLTQENFLDLTNTGNEINSVFQKYQNYNTKKNVILPQLQNVATSYSPIDPFYPKLQSEIKHISEIPKVDYSKYPFLVYYISTLDLSQKTKATGVPKDDISSKNLLLNNFQNAGDEFKTSGLEHDLLYNYMVLSSLGANNLTAQETKIDNSIQTLLDEVGEETTRGQEILSGVISFLNSYGKEKMADKYMKKAQSMTCNITPDLKNVLDVNHNIQEGKQLPNVKFTHKLDGKYNSLYDIKTKYKLVLVWASWCSHCQEELPYLKQFYDNFKKSGGEIIGLSVDYDKADWQSVTKTLPWLNDSELLGWDSSFSKKLNVSGTPTLFLLDNNNKILKIAAQVSEISNLVR